jgi:FAD/FMN-containing dehydrogenase
VSALVTEFPGQAIQESDAAYESVQNSYWSGTQKDLKPTCFFQPRRAEEVGRAVYLCVEAQCPFGIKSGGHGHYAGQSCLDGGIQLDLVKLNTIEIDKSKGTVTVGAGCTWRSVYETLQKEGCIAVGGRSADVGVGGFLIGGMPLTILHVSF